MKQGFRKRLDELVDGFVAGDCGFEDFQRKYSATYADEVADRDFSPEEIEHYGAIHERAEWTAVAPSPEERGLGWLDIGEFTRWLKGHRGSLPSWNRARPS